MVQDIERLGRDRAAATLRPVRKRYKNVRTRKSSVAAKKIFKDT